MKYLLSFSVLMGRQLYDWKESWVPLDCSQNCYQVERRYWKEWGRAQGKCIECCVPGDLLIRTWYDKQASATEVGVAWDGERVF